MPFSSTKQRKWMHANEPEIAEKWEKEAKRKGTAPVKKKKVTKKAKKK